MKIKIRKFIFHVGNNQWTSIFSCTFDFFFINLIQCLTFFHIFLDHFISAKQKCEKTKITDLIKLNENDFIYSFSVVSLFSSMLPIFFWNLNWSSRFFCFPSWEWADMGRHNRDRKIENIDLEDYTKISSRVTDRYLNCVFCF